MFEFHPADASEPHSLLFRFACPQRILIVTDGSLSFTAGGFGLSELMEILRGAGHVVSTARRQGGGGASLPGAFDFATAVPAVTEANYDQLWLFGFNSEPLDPPERTAVAKFMQTGGGVFATGDHEAIGSGMGLSLPRVRGMRNWSSIPMSAPERLDTVVDRGSDGVKQFHDQADEFPQRIYPVWFSNGGPSNSASTWSVHSVLRDPSGAVDVLPDHPHESECLAPEPTAGTFAGVEEWPVAKGIGGRIAPQIAAISISAGRFITDVIKPPVKPRCFGAISVYDGDKAGVGRIVCDATWHHFVNVNLNGAGAPPDSQGTPRRGLYVDGAATPEYHKIRRYFLNTARWLAPIGRRQCWPIFKLLVLRFHFELLEVPIPRPHPCPWEILVHIGQRAEEVLLAQVGPGAELDLLNELLEAGRPSAKLVEHLTPTGELAREPALVALSKELRQGTLGSLLNLLAHELPEEGPALERVLDKGQSELANKLLSAGFRSVEELVAERVRRFARTMVEFTRGVAEAPSSGKGGDHPPATGKRGRPRSKG
ncbi:MAG: hypothetical protein GC161_13555 [Planctomycetaceae bacterium]|nr:hypothetical protein [Planctomycetaceae bacterium]